MSLRCHRVLGRCGALLLLMGVGQCAGQTVTVLADRDFSLGPKEIGPVGSGALLAQPDRLEFVGIGRRAARIVVADPDGVVQSTSPDIVNVHQQIYKAMPRPDGSVWVVASGPHAFAAGYGAVDVPGIAALTTQRALSASGSRGDASFIQMDLYTPDGKRVDSARVGGPFETVPRPIGVWDDGIVFRSLSRALLMSVSHGQTKEVASAAMPEVRRTLSLTTPDGKVIVIERESGRYVVADSPVMQISGLKKVVAATFRDGWLHAVGEPRGSKVVVVKGDTAYECVMRHPFRPRLIDVSGKHIYMADFAGRGERFSLP